ncbi:MAG: hypothetical protein KA501_11840 [Bacteroidia bacterium]|nr:hypothetical protein [Bacteroidia bacterium]
MHKIFVFLPVLLAVSFVYAQTDSLTREEKLALDSMFKNDEFFKLMMGPGKKKSYFDVRVNAGNQLLSTTNNNTNAGGLKSQFTLIPTVGYYHKSGFGLDLSAFCTSDSGSFKPYQYAISPYFEYNGKSVYAGLSYTRYITDKSSNLSPNPFQNSFYGNFIYTKPFIEPGISISYTTGDFTDSVEIRDIIRGILRNVKMKISDFSIAPYIQHQFYFYKLFSKNDRLNFSPAILLIAGRQQVRIPGLDNERWVKYFPNLRRRLKNRFESDSRFQLQSVAASLTIRYMYKKFYISPNFYIDYYLSSTTEKRLTTVFSFVVGFSF